MHRYSKLVSVMPMINAQKHAKNKNTLGVKSVWPIRTDRSSIANRCDQKTLMLAELVQQITSLKIYFYSIIVLAIINIMDIQGRQLKLIGP